MNTYFVIPAYNEENSILNIVNSLKEKRYKNIIVVDDNSSDKTNRLLKDKGIKVIKHIVNRGAGAATKTGIDYALNKGADKIVTLDADGQHSTEDISNLLFESEEHDVIIGSRFIEKGNTPIHRRAYNKIGNLITYFFYGLHVKDSQSGFKVFSKNAAKNIKITFDRYEFCSEIISEIKKKNLTYKEIPIKAIYTKESLKKGQSLANGINMVFRMLFKKLRKK